MVWSLNVRVSVRMKRGWEEEVGGRSFCMCVSVRVCVCVCVFDVMFVHSVVAMAPSLTPDARENCVPIPFWPTESGR